ncbi:FAD-dependent oxidoreductase [Streptomyces tubercidicus]
MTRKQRTAAVVGGGIGGLATALALRRSGWSVEVFERARHLPETGTALGLWPTALGALDTLGVGAQVRALSRPQTSGAFLRPDGGRIATLDLDAMKSRTCEVGRLISRPDLLSLLHEAAGEVTFGTRIDDLRPLDGSYDVVIAADGLNSAARTALFGPRHRARYVGASSWRGTVDGETGGTTETWGEGLRFGITPSSGGRTNWFACAVVPEGQRDPGREAAALRARFGHWRGEGHRQRVVVAGGGGLGEVQVLPGLGGERKVAGGVGGGHVRDLVPEYAGGAGGAGGGGCQCRGTYCSAAAR